jgi:hypothetical protein
MGSVETFKAIMFVMLFYSASITLLSYAIPADARQFVTVYSNIGDDFDLESVSTEVSSGLQSQTNIPVIELGALVFYSGNLLLDLILNFMFAIPQMFGILIHGILFLINVDSYIWATVQTFSSVIFIVLYTIGLLQMLLGTRSGRAVA